MPPLLFPKMLYKEDGSTRVVATQAEQDALGPTWSSTPTVVKRGLYRIACKATTFVVAAPNTKRRTFKIANDSGNITRILYGDGASDQSWTWILDPGERWEMPMVRIPSGDEPEWSGLITAITESESGNLNVTETLFN